MSAWFGSTSVARYCLNRCVGLESFPEIFVGDSPDEVPTPFSISSWRSTPAMSGARPSDNRMDEGRGEEYQSWGLPRKNSFKVLGMSEA